MAEEKGFDEPRKMHRIDIMFSLIGRERAEKLLEAGWTVAECGCCWVPPWDLLDDESGWDYNETLAMQAAMNDYTKEMRRPL